jgi:hypothetical protein
MRYLMLNTVQLIKKATFDPTEKLSLNGDVNVGGGGQELTVTIHILVPSVRNSNLSLSDF